MTFHTTADITYLFNTPTKSMLQNLEMGACIKDANFVVTFDLL